MASEFRLFVGCVLTASGFAGIGHGVLEPLYGAGFCFAGGGFIAIHLERRTQEVDDD